VYIAYHDTEWGVPVRADSALFEMLCLEGAQAGLSWITVLRKRETYRRAFDDFDAEKMSRYNAAKRRRLLQDPGIIRNRLKVDAFIANARAYLAIRASLGSFSDYIWQFTDGRVLRRRPLYLGAVAASTAHSDAMSKDLKQKGFKFVGSTICYAFMQAVGIVNEHQRYCWVAGKEIING
jgi:DNA-3-methyladenine glycosylase I